MRSRSVPGVPNRCQRCYVLLTHCLCPSISPVQTETKFTVIRHRRERHKTTNTARIAALAMPALELLEYGARDTGFDDSPFAAEGTWVLFPGSGRVAKPGEVKRLVVLDGTWSEARRMVKRLPVVGRLPRFSVEPAEVEIPRLRRPPFPGGMSTFEAIAEAVRRLEGPERAEPLFRLHAQMVEQVLVARGMKAKWGQAAFRRVVRRRSKSSLSPFVSRFGLRSGRRRRRGPSPRAGGPRRVLRPAPRSRGRRARPPGALRSRR